MRRHRYSQRGGGGKGSLLLVGILILAVAAGYAGTKYFIAPYILEGKLWAPQQSGQAQGQDPAGNGSENGTPGVISGEQDIKDAKDMPTGAAVTVTGAAAGTQTPQTTAPAAGVNGAGTQGTNGTDGQQQTPQPQGSGTAATTPQTGQSQSASAPAPSAATGKYAVQFGSFSTKEAANKAVSELAAKNITASVIQRGDAYKVVGASFDTKDQAKAEAERLKGAAEDAFVTTI